MVATSTSNKVWALLLVSKWFCAAVQLPDSKVLSEDCPSGRAYRYAFANGHALNILPSLGNEILDEGQDACVWIFLLVHS